ncbi:hypothetical protein HYU94_03775 [Candidatus Daviesbacteria bacterium]|nr:hypothetical protein [Candidatus Daviesbacteria bacterium]
MLERQEKDKRAFESTARSLGIPQRNWGQPVVEQFIDFVSRVDQLQEDISVAAVNTPNKFIQSLAQERQLLNSPSLKHQLRERYSTAELLLRAVKMVLTMDAGEQYQADPRRYVASKINAALRGYGYRVEEDKENP